MDPSKRLYWKTDEQLPDTAASEVTIGNYGPSYLATPANPQPQVDCVGNTPIKVCQILVIGDDTAAEARFLTRSKSITQVFIYQRKTPFHVYDYG